ncbi:MAG: LysR substrate-binding domain-containing protein [Nocardioidaceae bacterium]
MPSLLDVWNVTRLRLVIELAKCTSLSQAAEALGVSQPSASEHIRLLNAAAGEPIVERHGRSLRLTSAGHVLAVYASQALSNLTAGESALAARAGLRTGTLELGASSVPGTYLVPDIIEEFQQQCPDVEVRVWVGSTAEVRKWLTSGRVTCAITCGAMPDERLAVTPLGPDEIVGVASPRLLDLSSDGYVDAGVLHNLTLLLQEAGSSTREYALGLLSGTDYAFRNVWELGSVDAVKRATRRGRGIGFLSTHTIADEQRRGEIVAFRVSNLASPSRRVSFVRLKGTSASPAERFLESILRSHLTRVGGVS